jgi:beta-lactamase regulating signal transducer with metallopeptidase domain/ketosteroid isomerase-like protein
MTELPVVSATSGLLDAAFLLAVKLTFLLLLAWLATSVFRKSPASLRHLLWQAAVVGCLCLPFLPGLLPDWEVVPDKVSIAGSFTPAIPAAEAVIDEATPPVGSSGNNTDNTVSTAGGVTTAGAPQTNWPPVIAMVWLAGFLTVLARLGVGLLRVRAIVNNSRPIDNARTIGEAERSCRKLGFSGPIRLLVSRDVGIPFVTGWSRPVVVLPAAVTGWSVDRLRAVLLHELAHIRRYDPASTFLAGLATAVYWFHPLIWLASRKLKHEMESAADDCVLNAGTTSIDYARFLLDVSRGTPMPARLGAGVALSRHSQLGGRIMEILSPRRNRTPVGGRRRVLVVLAAVLSILPLASLTSHSLPATDDVSPADRAALIATLSGFYQALNAGEDYHIIENSFLAAGYFGSPDMTLETMDKSRWRAAFDNTMEMMKKEGFLGPPSAESRVKSVRREGDEYVMTLETDLSTRRVVVERFVDDGDRVGLKVARGSDGKPLPAKDAYLLRSHRQTVRFRLEDGSWKIAEYGDGLTIRRMDTNNPYGPIYLVWVEDMGDGTTPYGPMISKVIPEQYRPFNNIGITFSLED